MANLLWRIEGACDAPNRTGWAEGLTLHLLFQSLTVILARRGGQTRRYLALEGCPRCHEDGCERMCHRALFAQLVRTTLPGVTLAPVTRLIPHPGETRRLAIQPASAAALHLGADFLAPWPEGRLITTWSRLRARPMPLSVGALLAVSAAGPDPAGELRARGWSASVVGALTARAALQGAAPAPVLHGARAGEPLLHAIRDPWGVVGAPQATARAEA